MKEENKSRNIAWIDLESTGTSVTADRIVSIAAVKVSPDLVQIGDVKDYLVNPGIPIPAGATEVHGITDEMVKDSPSFKAYSRGLFDFLDGCDIGGFNSNRFDVPMLSEEFARVGIEWPIKGTNYADAMQIYHTEEKRDLKAAFLFYCDQILIDAHNAKADILATLKIYRAQKVRYEAIRDMTTAEIDLHYGGNIRVDLAGTMIINDAGVVVYNIGKDKGKSVVENPGFAHWMIKQDFTGNTKSIIRSLLHL